MGCLKKRPILLMRLILYFRYNKESNKKSIVGALLFRIALHCVHSNRALMPTLLNLANNGYFIMLKI